MHQPYLPGMPMPPRPTETRDARTALATYPAITTQDLCRYAKFLGASAELLVDSFFMRFGERVFPMPEHERCDRVLILPDGTPIRIQVKTRHTQNDRGDYIFTLRQRSERGCTGRGPYEPQDFDILAMVALSEGVIRFTADWHLRQVIHASEIAELRRNPRQSLDAALARLGHTDAIPGGWDGDLGLAA
ncbi:MULTISPECIES: hypothetical protein [Marivita]|uniref:PD(D/E)XK endonuclease domain-containing protein n=1 Tax=Marivita cryptomonadis TaxID=505252 RepID=A0A9Q2S3T4_9RHOB|nr:MULTISPECIES: hypothetical protein [Marivita]MBM2323652.1 hypothetical protein [Marivita cryptomonadis]MBM2333239.1 hypothetical protein [Marivita cryptomonadis]MBM2342818.1 hypothetical protein [Marivita cryptomonadis]MBM2347487.1 hypothetical protein [Marivita cryptomonadis]MBM2352170.1 hypothetical protein [Marivita cryptomonadis]